MKQINLIKQQTSEYGGTLLKTRKGRLHARPIDTKNTMHLVVRSSKAKDEYSLKKHSKKVQSIITKFSSKYGIKIHSYANAGNHLHLHIHVRNRNTYKPFIRAITSAIAMAVTGASRWKKSALGKFWDYRPYTKIVVSFRSFLNLKRYIELNQMEGIGYTKIEARFILASQRRDRSRKSGRFSKKERPPKRENEPQFNSKDTPMLIKMDFLPSFTR